MDMLCLKTWQPFNGTLQVFGLGTADCCYGQDRLQRQNGLAC